MKSQTQLSNFLEKLVSHYGGYSMAKDERCVRFGKRLRELREAKGMSRKQLAESMGLSERAIVQWELGEREPGWFNVLALCESLGVDCSSFTVAPKDEAAPQRGRPRKASVPENTPAKRQTTDSTSSTRSRSRKNAK